MGLHPHLLGILGRVEPPLGAPERLYEAFSLGACIPSSMLMEVEQLVSLVHYVYALGRASSFPDLSFAYQFGFSL